jgi:hypothetical protein
MPWAGVRAEAGLEPQGFVLASGTSIPRLDRRCNLDGASIFRRHIAPWLLGVSPKAGRGSKMGVRGLEGAGKTEFMMSACQGRKLFVVDTEGRVFWVVV